MTQWTILCARYSGIEKTAVHRLKAAIEGYLDPSGVRTVPVGILVANAQTILPPGRHIFLGIRDENPFAHHRGDGKPEEYTITVPEPDENCRQNIAITGADENGLLYGVVDFLGRYIPHALYSGTTGSPYYMHPIFTDAPMKPYHCTSAPEVLRRGLWTWGHTITDYRGYIDNMVTCKLNTLVIWNNQRPANAADVVAYAHAHGIQLYFGFAWGWGTDHSSNAIRYALSHRQEVVDEYVRDWADLEGDGIYFQSFTETSETTLDGIVIAEAVTEYVNDIANRIWQITPDLAIQFGLHATSVEEKRTYIARTDPRIEIIWEDCGAFPFSYTPERIGEDDYCDTQEKVEQLSILRGENDRFGCVFKGLTCLDWAKFRYPAVPYLIGEASAATQQVRLAEVRPIWRYVQAHWLKSGWYAHNMFRALSDRKGGDFTALALVEDGMFEAACYFPVLFYGEMLWSPHTDTEALLHKVALNPGAVFA